MTRDCGEREGGYTRTQARCTTLSLIRKYCQGSAEEQQRRTFVRLNTGGLSVRRERKATHPSCRPVAQAKMFLKKS